MDKVDLLLSCLEQPIFSTPEASAGVPLVLKQHGFPAEMVALQQRNFTKEARLALGAVRKVGSGTTNEAVFSGWQTQFAVFANARAAALDDLDKLLDYVRGETAVNLVLNTAELAVRDLSQGDDPLRDWAQVQARETSWGEAYNAAEYLDLANKARSAAEGEPWQWVVYQQFTTDFRAASLPRDDWEVQFKEVLTEQAKKYVDVQATAQDGASTNSTETSTPPPVSMRDIYAKAAEDIVKNTTSPLGQKVDELVGLQCAAAVATLLEVKFGLNFSQLQNATALRKLANFKDTEAQLEFLHAFYTKNSSGLGMGVLVLFEILHHGASKELGEIALLKDEEKRVEVNKILFLVQRPNYELPKPAPAPPAPAPPAPAPPAPAPAPPAPAPQAFLQNPSPSKVGTSRPVTVA
ncbi:unnamed protein product [Amoebophrya sp. A120]|nr:unnamed protein product [Amoebophrya sp. A120]|eukprot:GSA120T00012536001.1